MQYLGSKLRFLDLITGIARNLKESGTVLDLFSGTSVLGDAFKRKGYRVLSNDYLAFCEMFARCYVETDGTIELVRKVKSLIDEFNRLPPSPGYITEVYCRKSRYFQPKNGERIDAIRNEIERKCLEPELKAIAITSLIEASGRVDSTVGIQAAWLKEWSARSYNDISLRVPAIASRAKSGKGKAHRMDALDAVNVLQADIAYIDPPYNQVDYLGYYHIWETLALWDDPDHYGMACKRIDCKSRKSDFNSKRRFRSAWEYVIDNVKTDYLIVSFNNECYVDSREMESILSRRGEVTVIENDARRYIGSKMGVYNPDGDVVGKVSHLRNKEYLYVVSPEKFEMDLPKQQDMF